MKSNLPLAASAAAALFAVVTLSNVGSIPGLPGSPAASHPAASDAPVASSVTGPGGRAIGTRTGPGSLAYQATHNVVLPGTSPVTGTATGGTGTGGATASDAREVPTSSQPVIPDHPVAMPDADMIGKPAGTQATGQNAGYTTSGGSLSATGPAGVALSSTFTLESRPDSPHTLWIDPRGAVITNRLWNTASGGYPSSLSMAAFSYGDSDPSFDADDLAQLQVAWLELSADYAPFDINVTLAPQSDDAIGRSSSGDTTFGTQVMLSSTPDPHGMGGVAWLGGSAYYAGDSDQMLRQPALVWGGATGNGKSAAQAAAHEAGHTFGLVHEGAASTYYSGTSTWGPIMGTSYYGAMGQWSMGEFKGARLNTSILNQATGKYVKAHQDEVGTIRAVLGGAQSDNGADATAAQLSEGDSVEGLITSSADTDAFTYTGLGGVRVTAAPSAAVTDLDVALDVVDTTTDDVLTSGYNPPLSISVSNGYGTPTGGLDSSFYIPETDEEHTYVIVVSGGGNGASPSTDATAYSSYGSLGSYDVGIEDAVAPTTGDGDGGFGFDAITPLTRTPGVPIKLDVDYEAGDLGDSATLWAWKATPSSCVFSNPTVAEPSLTCPATATGAVTVTATARSSGSAAVTHSATFPLARTLQPAPTLALSVAGQSSSTVDVCAGNAAAVLATITDQYKRPIYGASVRLYAGSAARTVKSDINGNVKASIGAVPAASYSVDSLASGVFAAQATKVTRTVAPSTAPCFSDSDTDVTLADTSVVAVPGLTTPISARVVTDDHPATGVPVVFSLTYTSSTGVSVVKSLGTATTNAAGIATYGLKASTTTPSGVLKAVVAPSRIVPAAITSPSGTLTVATNPTVDFDQESFNINGETAFTEDGHRDDKLITGVTSVVAGRLEGAFGTTSIAPAGVSVTLSITYTVSGKTVVKRLTSKTDANGWFRISLLNPVPAGVTGTATIAAASSTLFPAIAEIPFRDSSGTQAVFETKLGNLSIIPSATSVAVGNQTISFSAYTTNPWAGGAVRLIPSNASVRFDVRNGSGWGWTIATSGGKTTFPFGGLTAGTWTITPATSTAYTAVQTSFTAG